eukprot:5276029-Lingulodinium_polyedra.AAC.1
MSSLDGSLGHWEEPEDAKLCEERVAALLLRRAVNEPLQLHPKGTPRLQKPPRHPVVTFLSR